MRFSVRVIDVNADLERECEVKNATKRKAVAIAS